MKNKRFTEEQIIHIIKEQEAGSLSMIFVVVTGLPVVPSTNGKQSLEAWK